MDEILRNELILELDRLKEKLLVDNSRLDVTLGNIQKDDILYNLIELLIKSDKDKIFDKKIQLIGNLTHVITYEYLALWILKRAIKISSHVALTEYLNYLNNDNFECYYIMWLHWIEIEEPMIIDRNMVLTNAYHLTLEKLKGKLNNNYYSSMGQITSNSVLVYKFMQKKEHIDVETKNPYKNISSDNFQTPEDIRLLLTISSDKIEGIQSISINIFPSEDVPTTEILTTSFTDYRVPSFPCILNQEILSNLQKLYKQFSLCNNKNIVRLALKRLNDYATLYDEVNRAVEIRIILEMLFTVSHEKDNSISKQLRINISKKYGVNAKERSKLSHKTITIYDWCSEAIHTGQIIFHTEEEKENFNILFKEFEEIIRLEIIDIINNKESTWRK